MIDPNTFFNKRFVSGGSFGANGRKILLKSETAYKDDEEAQWRLEWCIPDVSTYDGTYITISRGSQEVQQYPVPDGTTSLRFLPKELKFAIATDFNAHTAVEEKPVQQPQTEIVIQSESVYGTDIALIHVQNLALHFEGQSEMWVVRVNGVQKGNYSSLQKAESQYEYSVGYYSGVKDSGPNIEYNGYTIDYEIYTYNDGTSSGTDEIRILDSSGKIVKTFLNGDEVKVGSAHSTTQLLGIISMDINADTDILKQYIDFLIDPSMYDEWDEDYVSVGEKEVKSWGWYATDTSNPHNPFSTIELNEVYTIANTDGRILGIIDDDLWPVESGSVHLVVKEGWRVRLKMMTQYRDFFKDNLIDVEGFAVEHTQYNLASAEAGNQKTNYDDTDKITFDLFGGDELHVDIDDRVESIERFNIYRGGKTMVKGAPRKINDETFLAIITVEKVDEDFVKPSGPSGETVYDDVVVEGDKVEEDEAKVSPFGLFIIAIGIMAIGGIMWYVLKDGEGE
jgi:hypothetical protein